MVVGTFTLNPLIGLATLVKVEPANKCSAKLGLKLPRYIGNPPGNFSSVFITYSFKLPP